MSYRVGKSKDGRVLVLDRTSGFVASRVDGTWTETILFSASELNTDFTKVRDQAEAESLYSEACAALNKNGTAVSA
ncbi:hypothetical protein KF728_18595 [Candidatus Obscuribacterales bacterium]|jgi:hypothetical protein|nr:hypothetical protein [Candidatus Obscuribacterales bacterium]